MNNGATGGWSVSEVAKLLHRSTRTISRYLDALSPKMAVLVRTGRNGRRIIPLRVINDISEGYGVWQDWSQLNK